MGIHVLKAMLYFEVNWVQTVNISLFTLLSGVILTYFDLREKDGIVKMSCISWPMDFLNGRLQHVKVKDILSNQILFV